MCAFMQTHTYKNTDTRTQIHTDTHTQIHTHTHAQTHTHAHAHRQRKREIRMNLDYVIYVTSAVRQLCF